MPRARPTRIPCDCFDCKTFEAPNLQQRSIPAWKASALQEPPPKCLVFLLPGEAMQEEAHMSAPPVPHLNHLAAEGCSGLLALRILPASLEGQTQGCKQMLAHFLGVHEPAAEQAQQSLAERYKDLAAGIASSDTGMLSIAEKAAVTRVPSVCDSEAMIEKQLPDAATAVDNILTVFGLKRCLAAKAAALNTLPSALFESATDADEDDDDLDMLILDPGSATDRAEAFAWADAVVGHLCGNEDVKDSILMVLLMPADQPMCSPCIVNGASLPPGMRRPRQSYEYLGVQEVQSQRDSCVVMAQRLKGVVRCDNVKAFTYEECSKWGAAGGILLERLLPELAFKLGRASKYGA